MTIKPILRDVLARITGNDQRAIRWFEAISRAAIPEGGAVDNVLVKLSDESFDIGWRAGAPVAWGEITGVLSNQTDLQAELNARATAAQGALADSAVQPGDPIPQVDVTGLVADLASKAALVHTHPLSQLQQSGAIAGQVPEWNGAAWVPASLTVGGGSGSFDLDDGSASGGGAFEFEDGGA